MRSAGLLVGLSATALVAFMATPAHAAPGKVDGSVTAAGTTCSWTNADTTNTPPNTLTINHTTVSPTCTSALITVTLSASPTVTFNDTPPGTATSPQVNVVATAPIVGTCNYRVNNVTVNRQGTTRTYTRTTPLTATKTGGGILCPASQAIDSVRFTFH
ncbi:hypothetical protein [Thermomonospora echinospora]|nr:hypothetical protein [Thermomonospora echinospora]